MFYLLIFNANANPTEEKLLDASQNGNEGLVKTILEKSETDVNFQKNGETALILAAKNGNEEIVKVSKLSLLGFDWIMLWVAQWCSRS